MTSEQQVTSNGGSHKVFLAGQKESPAVVLLHGFPTGAILWERQMPALAAAGYRAIAPDLRGAVGGGSPVPKDSEDCSIPNVIVKDIAGIMDSLGIKKAHVVGHDWGSAVAWAFAALYPDRTLDLISISVGHPSNYLSGDHLGDQKQKSWYMLLLNIPGKGEEALMAGAMAKGLVSAEAAAAEGPMWASFKTFEHLAQPGVATAALSWYRANAKPECFYGDYGLFPLPPVTCDTLQIWPTGDTPFCCEGQAKSSGNWVKPPGKYRYERLESPSHFAIWTDPEPSNKLILDFLKRESKL